MSNHDPVISQLRALVLDNNRQRRPERSEFFYYFGLGHVNRAMPLQDATWQGFGKRGDEFCKRMFILATDFDHIVTVLHKIDWLTCQREQSRLSEDDWSAYITTDIHLFHTELRSICDSVAKAIGIASSKAGQLPESFSDLIKFCQSRPSRANDLIGDDFVSLIRSANWFVESRHFRDQIIHFERDVQIGKLTDPGNRLLVFRTVVGHSPDDVYQGPEQFRYGPDGWLMFAPYAGYYFGRLWCFLNEMCRIYGTRMDLPKGGFSWVPQRLPVALSCISSAVELLEKQN